MPLSRQRDDDTLPDASSSTALPGKRFLLITDAWAPQTNGVVTTWSTVVGRLEAAGIEVEVIHPGLFHTFPLPTYPEIQLARNPWLMKRHIADFRPDYAHIATEGSLGLYGRWLLTRHGIPYTSSLHTKFPEYVYERARIPVALGYRFIRWFHRPPVRTLVTTESMKAELEHWGLADLIVWRRGVDIARFEPAELPPRERPRLLYVGRIAVEKSIEDFLKLDVDADKIIVGDGPQKAALERAYPQAQWLGYRKGQALVDEYAKADAFVFPSRTDTFGLVMLEANACGTPVAAYPVTGPNDVVTNGVNGWLDDDLGLAIARALDVSRQSCRAVAEANTWDQVGVRLLESLEPIDWTRVRPLLPR